MTKTKYFQVFVYFAIAFVLTFVFNTYLPEIKLSKLDIKAMLTGFGPLLSGLICYQVFKTENTYQISFSGVRPTITFGMLGLAVLLPLLLISKVSKETLVFSIITQFVYSFGEEFGWRHYLLNLTSGMNRWVKPFFVGTIWFLWHFSFGNNPIKIITGQDIPNVIGIPIIILFLSLLSFLWSDLTIKMKSIFIPTLAHAITKFGDSISVGIIVTLLFLLQVFWNKLKLGERE